MPTYTVKLFHPGDARFRAHDLDCEHDDDAIGRAAALKHTGRIELWEGDRLVWEFESHM